MPFGKSALKMTSTKAAVILLKPGNHDTKKSEGCRSNRIPQTKRMDSSGNYIKLCISDLCREGKLSTI